MVYAVTYKIKERKLMEGNFMGRRKAKSFFILVLIMIVISGCSKVGVKDDAFKGESVVAERRSLIQKHISDPAKQAQTQALLRAISNGMLPQQHSALVFNPVRENK